MDPYRSLECKGVITLVKINTARGKKNIVLKGDMWPNAFQTGCP